MTRGRSGQGSSAGGEPLLGLDLTETYVFLGGKGRAEAVPLTDALWDEMADQTGGGAHPWASRPAGEVPEQGGKRQGEEKPHEKGPETNGPEINGPESSKVGSSGPGSNGRSSNGRGAKGPDPEGRGRAALHGAAHSAALHGAPLHGEGWYVSAYWLEADMATWERHATGNRLIIAQSGVFTLLLDHQDGRRERVPLKAAGSVLVPSGCWHRLTVEIPGMVLFITPSHGTEHRLA